MPPILKKLNTDRIKIASKLLKKDQDFLTVSPELIKDLRDRTLFSTPSMRLSFAQYDKMCNDDEVLGMMSTLLNKPKAKLKKFCKYLSVFKKNIYLSPNKITAKITEADTQDKPIFKLPKEIRTAILDKFAEILPSKYVLLDWINKDKINWNELSLNPNAIDLLEENYDNIYWDKLSLNPNAIELLKKQVEYEQSLTAIEHINLRTKIDWYSLSTNPSAIDLLIANPTKIIWDELCLNTNAIDLLEKNPTKINWQYLSENHNAIHLLKKQIEYENSLTIEEYNNLDDHEIIDWKRLCANPNTIDLLKDNKNKIIWEFLSRNSNAIKLLKERVKYENSLSKKEYIELMSKIDWYELSSNSKAINILKENQDKIVWSYLSKNINPNAIKLLKEKIKYENSLTKERYNNLNRINKIDWFWLSLNPNAINLLEHNQDKIYWELLSKNPSIFKAV